MTTERSPRALDELVWVFGYGSLMWRPGFVPDAFEPARLDGFRRSLCIQSHHYRGTPDRPGVVLGLVESEGAACVGRAIGFDPTRATEIMRYLDERELVTNVYERREVPLYLIDARTVVQSWAYIARPDHEQFLGSLAEDELVELVCQGTGSAGTCQDYVVNTLRHLNDIGIEEPWLEHLSGRIAIRKQGAE